MTDFLPSAVIAGFVANSLWFTARFLQMDWQLWLLKHDPSQAAQHRVLPATEVGTWSVGRGCFPDSISIFWPQILTFNFDSMCFLLISVALLCNLLPRSPLFWQWLKILIVTLWNRVMDKLEQVVHTYWSVNLWACNRVSTYITRKPVSPQDNNHEQ